MWITGRPWIIILSLDSAVNSPWYQGLSSDSAIHSPWYQGLSSDSAIHSPWYQGRPWNMSTCLGLTNCQNNLKTRLHNRPGKPMITVSLTVDIFPSGGRGSRRKLIPVFSITFDSNWMIIDYLPMTPCITHTKLNLCSSCGSFIKWTLHLKNYTMVCKIIMHQCLNYKTIGLSLKAY